MRNLHLLDKYRLDVRQLYGSNGDAANGAFAFPSPIDGQPLHVIASADGAWEHVSVSRTNRCPNWPEMEFIKRNFFKDEECAIQLHVPVSEHINVHPYTLHLWRCLSQEFPRPPAWMVG